MKKFIAIVMALMLVASVAVFTASAKESPQPQDYYSITVKSVGDGEASSDTTKIKIGTDGTVTLTAVEKGGKFINWVINGDYEIVSGSLTDKVIVIKPSSDIEAVAHFEGATKPAKTDAGTTAPKTGDMTFVVMGLMLLALGASVFAFKKIKE